MIELAPRELWKYDLTKDEARFYIFTLPGYRISTFAELNSLVEDIRAIDHDMWDAWTQDTLDSDNIPDDETGTVVPVRDKDD
jgi:hypothetical protein